MNRWIFIWYHKVAPRDLDWLRAKYVFKGNICEKSENWKVVKPGDELETIEIEALKSAFGAGLI